MNIHEHRARKITDSYLRYPRNVVRELDNLYEKCTEQLENADPSKTRQLVPTMLKIIQTVKNTIDTIPFDELEKEEELFQTVQLVRHYGGLLEPPDPLDEEDLQKLKQLIETEAPFEKIREFVEDLRCKDQDILFIRPTNRDPKEGVDCIRGRRINLTFLPEPESKADPSSTPQ